MPLFLTGYRGTGKTTIAHLLAKQLGWESFDADDEIERRAGKTIAQIFSEQGEPHFRDLEEQVVRDLSQTEETIIALGGGAILRPSTRELLKTAGPVVWLTATAETLAGRIAGDSTTADRRPNLTEQQTVLAEVQQVLQERTPLYEECATFKVDTEGRTPEQIAGEIVRWLRAQPTSTSLPTD